MKSNKSPKKNNKNFNYGAWRKAWLKIWVPIKDGLKNRIDTEYKPLFNFKKEWAFDYSGQKLLEDLRLEKIYPFQKDIRSFACLYTKKIKLPIHAEMLKIIDKKFFDSVTLYGILCLIYSVLINNEVVVLRAKLDSVLIDYINITINKYLKRKKEKKKIWENLTEPEKKHIKQEILLTIWANLEKLKVIKLISGYRERDQIITKVVAHYEFDRNLLDNNYQLILRDLPCIHTPKIWKFNSSEDNIPYGGGYHSQNSGIERSFIRKNELYAGKSVVKQKFVNIINRLQNTAWTIDSAAILFASTEFSSILNQYDQNVTQIRTEEDLLQKINTYLFLMEFCTCYQKFFYPFNIDFRGRIYPEAFWSFSPTSSKYIRDYLRVVEPLVLTDDASDWLYLKLSSMLNFKHESNLENLIAIKEFLPSILNKDLIPKNYSEYMIKNIVANIAEGKTQHLLQLDATCSAYQLIGIVLNSEKLMTYTNLIGENSEYVGPDSPFKRKDLYNYVIEQCLYNLPHPTMVHFLTRNLMKSLIMPKPYGKTQSECIFDLIKYAKKEQQFYDEIIAIDDFSFPDEIQIELLSYKDSAYSEYINKKIRYFSKWFFNHFQKVFEAEFPEIEEFMSFFNGRTAPLRNFNFETPFYSFQNKYFTSNTFEMRKKIDKVLYRLSFKRVFEEENKDKEKQSSAANFIHALDAFIVQLIVEATPTNSNIYTIHDCFIVSPNDASSLLTNARQAYTEVQNHVKTIPQFAKYHQKGSIPITSRNMLKISTNISYIPNEENL